MIIQFRLKGAIKVKAPDVVTWVLRWELAGVQQNRRVVEPSIPLPGGIIGPAAVIQEDQGGEADITV